MTYLKGLGALALAYIKESLRSKTALFWNLAFPLFFLFGFAIILGGSDPQRVTYILPGLLTITIIAGSFFGISMGMVMQRETGIYRRLRATPVTTITVVLAHSATALFNVSLSLFLQLVAARLVFHVHIQGSILDLVVALLLSVLAFIPLGLIIGSTARDMKTAPAITNLLFFPMMFLSGAAFPFFMLPEWLRTIARLLPATYVVEVLQGVLYRGLPLSEQLTPLAILAATSVAGFTLNGLLFRWESTEPLRKDRLAMAFGGITAIYLVAFVLGPQFHMATPPENSAEQQSGTASRPLALTGATVYDGLGNRLENACVVIEGNHIVAVSRDSLPQAYKDAEVESLSGRVIIPGLFDSHVHIGGSAGGLVSMYEYQAERIIRDLQAYLGTGVTAFVSLTDDVDDIIDLRQAVNRGTMRAPRPFFAGASITAPGGHPAARFQQVPGLAERMTGQVRTAAEAEAAVVELHDLGVDLIKMVLEEGTPDQPLPRLSEEALRAGIRKAHELGLIVTVHVDSDHNARLAVDAGADGLEHVPPDLSSETIERMRARGVTLTPTLAVMEAFKKLALQEPVADAFVQSWVDPEILKSLQSPMSWIVNARRSPSFVGWAREHFEGGVASLRRAWQEGVPIIAGSDAGNPATFHGVGLIRELELYREVVGMPLQEVLISATRRAADRLGRGDLGRIQAGALADLVVLAADPATDPHAFRKVQAVYFNGARVDRENLFTTLPGDWQPGRYWFSNSRSKSRRSR